MLRLYRRVESGLSEEAGQVLELLQAVGTDGATVAEGRVGEVPVADADPESVATIPGAQTV